MNTTIRRVMSFLCFLATTLPSPARGAEGKTREVEIELCDFQVGKEIAQANASFSVIYTVQVGDDGRPVKVEKERNEFLPDESFVSCIKNWLLPAGRWIVAFSWTHGKGWTEIAVSGNDLNYRLKIPLGVSNQYGKVRPSRKGSG